MNLIEFTKIVSDPSSISKRQTRGLDKILEEYPFFQAAHFLRLYALKKQRSFRYNDALKKTAAFTTDRELLFNYITNFDFELPTESEIDPATTAGNLMKSVEDESKDERVLQEEPPVDSPDQAAQSDAETALGIGSPLDFKSDESYSFGEWLQLSQLKPIDRSKPAKSKARKPLSNLDLINDFIGSRPKIGPVENETFDDLSLESSTENDQLMTETLAHVYLEQKKYEKAIAAFTVLSLKYPEKSSFFADRIEAVRKLQNN
jgi:hypothetical protein